jgi:hypothetical protein
VKLLLIVLLSIAGCAEPAYRNLAHPNFGDAEFNQDREQCARVNTSYTSSSNAPTASGYRETRMSPVTNWAMVDQCLALRGWRKVQQ